MSVAKAQKAVAAVTHGKDSNEDAWMTAWTSTNWGKMLQPAPLSLCLLGSIMCVAASTDDFSLLEEAPKDGPLVEWKYVFKSCLQQVVGDSYSGFEKAHTEMRTVSEVTEQIPSVVRDIVRLVLEGDANDIQELFGPKLDGLLDLSRMAQQAAERCHSAFDHLCGLASEVGLACTHKSGTTEQKLQANKNMIGQLTAAKAQQEQMLKLAAEREAHMKKAFDNAESDFRDAVHSMPSGWDLVGMNAVDTLMSAVKSAVNTGLSMATYRQQLASQAANGIFGNKDTTKDATPKKGSTGGANPDPATLQDPGLVWADQCLVLARSLQALIGLDGAAPEWDHIRAKTPDDKTGATYTQSRITTIRGRLEPGLPVSDQLNDLLATALDLVKSIIQIGASQAGTEPPKKTEGGEDAEGGKTEGDESTKPADPFAQLRPKVAELVTQLTRVVTKANLLLKQTGVPAQLPGTHPEQKADDTTSSAKMAVDSAKFKLDQNRQNLAASRESYDKAADQLQAQQKTLSETIVSMTKLELTNKDLRAMLPVLAKAISAFATLRDNFSQLVTFFSDVTSLLSNTMGPSVSRWSKDLSSGESRVVAGMPMSKFLLSMIYQGMMTPVRAAKIAQLVSTAYLHVSDQFVVPALSKVGAMMEFAESDDEAARRALQGKLAVKQKDLAEFSARASTEIGDMIAADQKKFLSAVDKRLSDVVNATKSAFANADVAPAIKQTAEEHVKEEASQDKADAKNDPLYDDSVM